MVYLATIEAMKQSERIEQFCTIIWQWYSVYKRTLPWRDLATTNQSLKAYQILVSEVMLQQTQVSRVQVKWKQWLEVFPNSKSLASAGNAEVIQAWQGMGYNSRALRLRDAAIDIERQYGGEFPQEMNELLAIKGIGTYTAAAVRNFAFGIPTACIDTNIRRILHRTFFGPENQYGEYARPDKDVLQLAEKVLRVALSKKCIQELSANFVSSATAEWHAALMDYGSLVCIKRNPNWSISPLARAGISKAAYKIPVQIPKQRKEPGRMIGAIFVPNRIIRGRIVEVLREYKQGATLQVIGPLVCIDWHEDEHTSWLQSLLKALLKDSLIQHTGSTYHL